jgi:phosphoglycolate phosphatase
VDRTFFFDLDGTLTDPFVGITHSIQFALERLGVDVPEASELAWCIGPPLQDNFSILVGEHRAPAAVAYYRERFADVGLYENTLYPGIHDALSRLADSGSKLCVASSKPHVFVKQILEHFELDSFFAHVFGSELDGTRTDKGDLLRHALSESASEASASTMIGDRKHDILGAIQNGTAHVGVLYGYGSADELREAGARRFANSPDDLTSLLL